MAATTHEFHLFTVIRSELCEGVVLEAIWHGGYGVNIYIGDKEVDYISDMTLKTNEDFQSLVAEYIIRFIQTLKEELNNGDSAA